jgi:hypothetical protein
VRSARSEGKLIGREPELERLGQFLSGADTKCLVLLGEPGIGKTSLWEAGITVARELGYVVLSARASHAEAGLPFTALGDPGGSSSGHGW